jgi:hypothetical protein
MSGSFLELILASNLSLAVHRRLECAIALGSVALFFATLPG